MKFENIRVMNFENALRGMRNPKDSWHLSDSKYGLDKYNAAMSVCCDISADWAKFHGLNINSEEFDIKADEHYKALMKNGIIHKSENENFVEYAFIGPKDMRLARGLIKGGSEHRKFLRQIFVTVDITAPLYW